jgi:hypothetical protein
VKLSNIARSLKEEIPLVETEKRLSRSVPPDTVLVLDLSDIRKEYAQRMEYLATVQNASSGELHQGSWLFDVTAAEVSGSEIVPLYRKLYSTGVQDFRSENDEVLAAVDLIRSHTQGRGIWVIDRGSDRKKLLEPLAGEHRTLRHPLHGQALRHRPPQPVRHGGGSGRPVPPDAQGSHREIQDGREKVYDLR